MHLSDHVGASELRVGSLQAEHGVELNGLAAGEDVDAPVDLRSLLDEPDPACNAPVSPGVNDARPVQILDVPRILAVVPQTTVAGLDRHPVDGHLEARPVKGESSGEFAADPREVDRLLPPEAANSDLRTVGVLRRTRLRPDHLRLVWGRLGPGLHL